MVSLTKNVGEWKVGMDQRVESKNKKLKQQW